MTNIAEMLMTVNGVLVKSPSIMRSLLLVVGVLMTVRVLHQVRRRRANGQSRYLSDRAWSGHV